MLRVWRTNVQYVRFNQDDPGQAGPDKITTGTLFFFALHRGACCCLALLFSYMRIFKHLSVKHPSRIPKIYLHVCLHLFIDIIVNGGTLICIWRSLSVCSYCFFRCVVVRICEQICICPIRALWLIFVGIIHSI